MRFLEERGEGCAVLDRLAGFLDGQWCLGGSAGGVQMFVVVFLPI